jgi:hypothetical protein
MADYKNKWPTQLIRPRLVPANIAAGWNYRQFNATQHKDILSRGANPSIEPAIACPRSR